MKVRPVHMVLAVVQLSLATAATAQDRKPPYWASIASGEAMTRAGPGRNYPGLWLYKRRDLPVKVLKLYENWRLIEDPDGARGWMLVSLMSAARTALVKPGEPRAIHEKPAGASRVAFLAEPGVVGKIDRCNGDFCRFSVGAKVGWIAQDALHGVRAGEVFKD
jgi:SH3-like domain-containing protein